MKNKSLKIFKKVRRETLKESGFFDGRFKPRVILDKKKELNKKSCRNSKKVW